MQNEQLWFEVPFRVKSWQLLQGALNLLITHSNGVVLSGLVVTPDRDDLPPDVKSVVGELTERTTSGTVIGIQFHPDVRFSQDTTNGPVSAESDVFPELLINQVVASINQLIINPST